eukprot:Phypoly_transcript_09202.p1 GENE.Phypoly_transcript_09202~~Phypoly_transcript_09202.p1  ORF type:complete len:188 (+),score=38.43 Phypoly_transcript_09202:815-1378(+)
MAYKQRWMEYFDVLDANKNGFIEPSDLDNIATTLSKFLRVPEDHQKVKTGVEANKRFFAGLIKDLDANKDGKVSREELLAGVEKLFVGKNPQALPQWWKDNLKQFFETNDLDQNGVLSYEELARDIRGTTPTETDENIKASYDWIIKISPTGKLDAEAALAGAFVWATSPNLEPECTRIYAFWRKFN